MILEELLCEKMVTYDLAREHLIIRACNYQKNKARLKTIPHRLAADLAVTCHLMEKEEDGTFCSTVVDYGLMEWMEVREEQLFADAFTYSPHNLPPLIRPMESIIDAMLGLAEEPPPAMTLEEQMQGFCLREDMPVLTNRENRNGAAVLFYPGVLELIGEQMGTDYFILPSSIHETILLPDDGTYRLAELEEMVVEINRSELLPKDYLSDSVYYFNRTRRIFGRAS
ncbi:MAG: hypothetical protein IKZ95_03805 [Lachnospiraceae bacterium]|nr:hypothetical protein [Lachnospiraceae bacterium]